MKNMFLVTLTLAHIPRSIENKQTKKYIYKQKQNKRIPVSPGRFYIPPRRRASADRVWVV
jgi:hypothetical protein